MYKCLMAMSCVYACCTIGGTPKEILEIFFEAPHQRVALNEPTIIT